MPSTQTPPTAKAPRATSRFRSVRARTTLVATAAVALVLVAAVAALTFGVERSLTNRVEAQGEAEVDLVLERLRAGASPSEALEAGTDAPVGQRGIPTYVAILDAEGSPVTAAVWDLPGMRDDGLGVGVGVDAGLLGRDATVEATHVGSNLAIAQRSIAIDGRTLLVVAVSPLGEVIDTIDTIVGLALIGVPLLVVVVALITWMATGRTLRPIETIRTRVDTLSSATLDQRVPVPATTDEVSRLAETMNGMLARLEAASTRQREFVSDASHELRSPVASIKANVEVSMAHPSDRSWPEVADDVLSETERLEGIVDDLLLLARFDEGFEPHATVVDVGCLIRPVTARYDGIDGVDIESHTVDGCLVLGNHTALSGVVRNLIDNAAHHAASTIVVTAAVVGGAVVITIDDDGPGIPASDRERVFDRFTRLDHPRSRTDGGVGLGLAVVDRVVHQHHGTITVDEAPLGGARFTVELPAAP